MCIQFRCVLLASILAAGICGCQIAVYYLEVDSFVPLSDSLKGSNVSITRQSFAPEHNSVDYSFGSLKGSQTIVVECDGIQAQCLKGWQIGLDDCAYFAVVVHNMSAEPVSVLDSTVRLGHEMAIGGERFRNPRTLGLALNPASTIPRSAEPMGPIAAGETTTVMAIFEKNDRKKPCWLTLTLRAASGTDYAYKFSFRGIKEGV